eukprot:s699_g21.t1
MWQHCFARWSLQVLRALIRQRSSAARQDLVQSVGALGSLRACTGVTDVTSVLEGLELAELSAKELASSAWSCSTLQARDAALARVLKMLAREAAPHRSLGRLLLATCLHRNILAARCELSSNLMTQRYRSMKVDELATQHPASTLCDFAKTELSSHLLLAGMATAATARLHELSAQDPAKACWEPVTVKLTSPEVQLLVADAVSVRLPCDAPSLASLARSAALLLAKDAALSGMLASAATSILDECSASNPADSA